MFANSTCKQQHAGVLFFKVCCQSSLRYLSLVQRSARHRLHQQTAPFAVWFGDAEHVMIFLLAGKQRAQYQVSKADSTDTIQEQWQGVVKIVQDSSSAFVYHMENHYCLVFAARSWCMDAGISSAVSDAIGSSVCTTIQGHLGSNCTWALV